MYAWNRKERERERREIDERGKKKRQRGRHRNRCIIVFSIRYCFFLRFPFLILHRISTHARTHAHAHTHARVVSGTQCQFSSRVRLGGIPFDDPRGRCIFFDFFGNKSRTIASITAKSCALLVSRLFFSARDTQTLTFSICNRQSHESICGRLCCELEKNICRRVEYIVTRVTQQWRLLYKLAQPWLESEACFCFIFFLFSLAS
jgi:hypothetical protein